MGPRASYGVLLIRSPLNSSLDGWLRGEGDFSGQPSAQSRWMDNVGADAELHAGMEHNLVI